MKAKNLIFSLIFILVVLLAFVVIFKKPAEQKENSSISGRNDSINKALTTAKALANKPWQIDIFNDEFGDPTSEKYLRTIVSGVFSNSATSNSELHVKVLVTKTDIGIFLHEYATSNPPQVFIGIGTIKMKNSANEIIDVQSSGDWNQNGGIKISNANFTKFIDFLKKSEGDIKVVIHDEYNSEYNFNIDVTSFKEEFKLLSLK